MPNITDRCGRKIRIFFRDSKGSGKGLDNSALKTVLRLKTRLSRITVATPGAGPASGRLAQKLHDKGIKKILGLEPVTAEITLWNGRSFSIGVPADIGNFLCDLNGIIKENQYNFENFKNAVVVDAGANIGLFSLYACARGAGKIYAFEPVRETYAILKNNIAANRLEKVVSLVNAALGAKQGTAKIKYCTRGEGSAMIAEGNAGVNVGLVYEAERKVKVLTLDYVIRRKVDLIKMDVEGYEGNVLLGAADLIREHKPVLSFSAYHRRTDKKTLPDIVRQLRKDYSITLNTFAEHDFYCE